MQPIEAFVINLDKSPDRWKFVTKQFQNQPQVHLNRLPAVYGRSLSPDDLNRLVHPDVLKAISGRKARGTIPHLSAIGCYLSHVKAWQTIESGSFVRDWALIMEDDAELMDPLFADRLDYYMRLLPDSWDVLVVEEVEHLQKPLSIGGFMGSVFQIPTEYICAAGYILRKRAASKLLRDCFPIRMQVDNYLSSRKLIKFCLVRALIRQNRSLQKDNLPILTSSLTDSFNLVAAKAGVGAGAGVGVVAGAGASTSSLGDVWWIWLIVAFAVVLIAAAVGLSTWYASKRAPRSGSDG